MVAYLVACMVAYLVACVAGLGVQAGDKAWQNVLVILSGMVNTAGLLPLSVKQ